MYKLALFAAVSLMSALPITSFALSTDEAKMIATAAQRGDDGSQVLMAVMYRNGDGGYSKDNTQAAHWFELAATQGNPYAQKMLGDIYAEGLGVAKNLKLSADWREKAAVRGNIQAQTLLGRMYLNGDGVTKDQAKGESWLTRAAAEGSSEAQFLLGKIYYQRHSSVQERAAANDWLAKSAAQGYVDSIRLLRFMENIGYDVEESFYKRTPHIRKLAEDGDAEAQYQLAIRYENGTTISPSPDYAQAMHWFTMAANQGHVMAMKSMADIYTKGLNGVSADQKIAAQWTDKARAAEKNH